MKTKGTLRTVYTTLPHYNTDSDKIVEGGGSTVIAFQWERLSSNKYLVVIPKLFKKAPGDGFAIVGTKKFLDLLSSQAPEVRN